MRVRVIKKRSVRDFAKKYPAGSAVFEYWYDTARKADWIMPSDILKTFTTADLLGNGSSRVVFDIGGNDFRMFCKYRFEGRRVRLYIKWIGSHADYSRLCERGLQYSVDNY